MLSSLKHSLAALTASLNRSFWISLSTSCLIEIAGAKLAVRRLSSLLGSHGWSQSVHVKRIQVETRHLTFARDEIQDDLPRLVPVFANAEMTGTARRDPNAGGQSRCEVCL